MEYRIISEASLKNKKATGKTKHFAGTEELPAAVRLQIAQYEGDNGFIYFIWMKMVK